MTFVERLQIAWAAFKSVGGVELPDAGRSSDESIGGAMAAYTSSFGSINPVIDFEMLKVLKCLWLYNPDFSQYVANIVNLGNPGHQLSVEARTDAAAEAAVGRLNESASRIYQHGVGVDGLLNQYLASVAWSGAISSEDVVNFGLGRVEKVALVPVEQIRFRYNKDLDTYEAFQKSSNFIKRPDRDSAFGLIRLNPETYKYYALSTVENSPYAKPPGTAAVEAILEGQKPLMDNIRFMAQKIGLMGLVTASVVPPRKKIGNETEDEYRIRSTNYLRSIKEALDGNFNKGLIATFNDQKIDHTPVTTGAAGVYDVNRINEEQVFSGLHAMPGFHGRTDSTTETFADVVYYLLTAQVENIQRIVKRRQERTYRLDLRMGGVEVDSVSLTFDKAHSRNAKAEAETEEIKLRVTVDKLRSGLISPDEAAQELGYESWFDVELLSGPLDTTQKSTSQSMKTKTVKLSFDKRSQKYRFQPERFEVWTGADLDGTRGNVVPMVKKKALRM